MPENQASPKRFIAGAVCPRCSEMDKIVMYKLGGADYRECVACGFNDRLHIQPAAKELETRVNTPEEVKQQQTQVLSIQPLTSEPKAGK